MLRHVEAVVEELAIDYLLSEGEVKEFVGKIKVVLTPAWLRSMYQAGTGPDPDAGQRVFAYDVFDAVCLEIAKKRERVALPATEDVQAEIDELAKQVLKAEEVPTEAEGAADAATGECYMEIERKSGWGVRFTLTANGIKVRLQNLEGLKYDLERTPRPLVLALFRDSEMVLFRQSETVLSGDETGLNTMTPEGIVQRALEYLADLLHKPVMAGSVSSPASFARRITEEWVVSGGQDIPWRFAKFSVLTGA